MLVGCGVIRLSTHASKRAAERKIALAWVELTVSSPDWIAADHDPALTHSFKAIAASGGRVLKVAHRVEEQDLLIVTAYLDRGARR